MRQGFWGGLLMCGLAVGVAGAQMNVGAQQQSTGPNQSVLGAIFQPVTGAPYQAEKLSRSVQTLSDGTVITQEYKGTIARDGQGRLREDLYTVSSGLLNGHERDRTLKSATVGDPVSHSMLFWSGTTSKMAMRMQLPVLPSLGSHGVPGGIAGIAVPPPPPPGGAPQQANAGPHVVKEPAAPGAGPELLKDEVRTEELGHQVLEGVMVTGKRVTTTIPTGKVGNDRPIVVVHEEWRSPELKLLMKTVDTDPRSGEQTMELQGLVRTEPDAALFQAPEGYQIKDMAEMMKGLGQIGRAKSQ